MNVKEKIVRDVQETVNCPVPIVKREKSMREQGYFRRDRKEVIMDGYILRKKISK